MLDKASHLIPDLILCPFVHLRTTSFINWHSFYKQWHVSLTFLIILIINLVQYDLKLLCMVSPLKMSMCFEKELGCSFHFKYQVPVETHYVQLADHELLHIH